MADLAVDLGTANTLINRRGAGLVLNEPSVIAVERSSGAVRAIGLEAKRMLGRTPEGTLALRPMRDGVIADVELAERMLRHFLSLVLPSGWFRSRPQVVVGVPSGLTEMERRAVRAAVLSAGAKTVHLIGEPLASALGAGLPVIAPRASMVVNIGGGTTEIGIIALGGMVAGASLRIGGDELDEAIVAYIRKQHNLLIGESTAENIKIQIGAVHTAAEEREMAVHGRDLVSGIPKTVRLCTGEIRECIEEPVQAILGAVRKALENTPPELSADIVDEGLVLTGGGSLLRGLEWRLAEETGLQIRKDEEPLLSVVRGAAEVLEHWTTYRGILEN